MSTPGISSITRPSDVAQRRSDLLAWLEQHPAVTIRVLAASCPTYNNEYRGDSQTARGDLLALERLGRVTRSRVGKASVWSVRS
jgi:DeoR/GlpR family transcriptional regulator of sugar metabolism